MVNFVETIVVSFTDRPPSMGEEKICHILCEMAQNQLLTFFRDLQSRRITPSQIEDVQNAGELSKTLEIVKKFLSLKLFSDQQVTINELEKEIRFYQSFTERNKKLKHFAHKFTEFSAGLLKMLRALLIDFFRRGNGTKGRINERLY